MTTLDWPREAAGSTSPDGARLVQAGSNICLDLHGDPQQARLHVFPDGNHHMALAEALRAFLAHHPQVGDVFYATTPPRVIVEWFKAGSVHIGNLTV